MLMCRWNQKYWYLIFFFLCIIVSSFFHIILVINLRSKEISDVSCISYLVLCNQRHIMADRQSYLLCKRLTFGKENQETHCICLCDSFVQGDGHFFLFFHL